MACILCTHILHYSRRPASRSLSQGNAGHGGSEPAPSGVCPMPRRRSAVGAEDNRLAVGGRGSATRGETALFSLAQGLDLVPLETGLESVRNRTGTR